MVTSQFDTAAARQYPATAQSSRPHRTGTARHRSPGLDGLRALAVLVVAVFHSGAGLPGGFLGVDVFFVISGYLITSLLSAELRQRGRIGLPAFWQRRARRLLPGLLVVLTATVLTALFIGDGARDGLRGDAPAALAYVSNWWQIHTQAAYFADLGAPPMLQHLWSLAIEEQFYLLWPLLLWGLLRFLPTVHAVRLTVGGAVASFLAMGVLCTPGTDPSRVYLGTDTHAGGLLLGAALALVHPLAKARARPASSRSTRLLDTSAYTALAVLVAGVCLLDGSSAVTYLGGLAVMTAAAGVVVLAAAGRGSVARTLSAGPLVWVGRRSYGIYLWHWPVVAACTRLSPATEESGWVTLLELVLPVLLAALTFRAVEEPMRVRGIRASLLAAARWCRPNGRERTRSGRWAVTAVAAGTGVALATATVAVLTAPVSSGAAEAIRAGRLAVAQQESSGSMPTGTDASGSGTGSGGSGRQHDRGTDDSGAGSAGTGGHTTAGDPGSGGEHPGAGRSDAAGPHGGVGHRGAAPVRGRDITAVGDSVLLASAPALTERYPGVDVQAEVGRQMVQGPALVEQLKEAGRLRRVLLVALGTNGPFPQNDPQRILRTAGPGRLVLFVTTHAPKPWQQQVNRQLRQAANAPNAALVDWNSAVSGRPDVLSGDNTHPNPRGARLHARLVARALAAHTGQGQDARQRQERAGGGRARTDQQPGSSS